MKNNLRYIRKHFNLNQTELAKACGISKTTISAIENGSGISLEHAIHISKVLQIPLRDIFPTIDEHSFLHPYELSNMRHWIQIRYFEDHPEEYKEYKKQIRESLKMLADDEELPF